MLILSTKQSTSNRTYQFQFFHFLTIKTIDLTSNYENPGVFLAFGLKKDEKFKNLMKNTFHKYNPFH